MGARDRLLEFMMAFAVLLAALAIAILVTFLVRGAGRVQRAYTSSPFGQSGALDHALDEAAKLNPFSPGVHGGITPRINVRYMPRMYEAALGEIKRQYTIGNAISIDFMRLDQRQAVRLADFCSGLASGSSGWIFRVTETAIILTPTAS